LLTYDYKLVRNEGDEVRTFKPDKIPTMLDNLAYIEGPNSCGKSTLLHILALSFHGLKNEGIPKSLKSKMKSLCDSEYQELTFKVELTNKDKTLSLISERTSPNSEIKVYELDNGDKKLISSDTLKNKYNIIYDIPDDPTDRLSQLTRDIQEAQLRYGSQVSEIRARMTKIVEEIRHSKDPNRLNDLNRLFEGNKKDIEFKKRSNDSLIDDLDILEKYTYQKYYEYYENEYKISKNEYNKTKKNIKAKDTLKKKINRVTYTKGLQARTAIKDMKETYNEVTTLLNSIMPDDEQNHLKIWERIELDDALQNYEFDENLKKECIYFKSVLNNLIKDKYESDKLKEAEFYVFLIKLLKSFGDLEIDLPGGIPFNEFFQEIQKSKKEFNTILKTSENISKAIDLLDKVLEMEKDAEVYILSNLKKVMVEDSKTSFEDLEDEFIEEKIAELNNNMQKNETKMDYYETEWSKKGRPSLADLHDERSRWERYSNYTEDQLIEQIKNYKNERTEIDEKIKDLEITKGRLEIQISELENKKDHPYRNHLDDLENKLIPTLQSLEQRLLNHFDEYITEIIKGEAVHSDDKEKEKYYNAIFTYLARRIDYVRYLSEEYKVEFIDLIEQYIHTDSGKKIRFADMGTGQGQSAYLMGKLGSADNRKIIALFDEVASMDSMSLDPIYKKFKELYNRDILLAGIVVQRADEVKVISKI